VTEIRRWADIYPDPLPDPNDMSEAEARALLKTIYQHPVVIAEFERPADGRGGDSEGVSRRQDDPVRDQRRCRVARPRPRRR